jgi:hypothetical protein
MNNRNKWVCIEEGMGTCYVPTQIIIFISA